MINYMRVEIKHSSQFTTKKQGSIRLTKELPNVHK